MKENPVEYKCKGTPDEYIFFRDNSYRFYGKSTTGQKYKAEKINGKDLGEHIRNILYDIYEPLGKHKLVSGKSKIYNTGYIDSDGEPDPPYSRLNFADTNYVFICRLVNWLNARILEGTIKKYTQIDFVLSGFRNELEKLFKIIEEYKYEIFGPKSKIIGDVIKWLKLSKELGDKAELETIRRLRLKGIKDIKKSEPGSKDDWAFGKDIIFSYNFKKRSIQVKSYMGLKIENNYYVFYKVGGLKYYDPKHVDFFSLYNGYKLYMFDNERKINDDMYTNKIKYDLKNKTLSIPVEFKRNI